MQINVIRNAKRNIARGFINRVILLICPFIERTAIQTFLGAKYLGLGSLFTSILSMLSLTELGFSSAMVYNMYKPVAENDKNKINALLNYYKKAYRIIGLVILLLGLMLMPFLPRLIKGGVPENINLTTLYVIYLINTSLSYFMFAYLSSIIVVHQREDVRSTINSIVKVSMLAAQIVALYLTKNYIVFCALMPLFTIVNNIWIAYRVRKLYPEYHAEGYVSNDDRKNIKKLVAGTFVQQACSVTRNSLDSICISSFLGLTMTAIYNNYFYIINGVTSFVAIMTASFTGGVGNHVATRTVKENFSEMSRLDHTYLWISGWFAICFLCLCDPFMRMWMGETMTLPISTTLLFSLYFYILKLGDVRSMYSSANGLWWEQRYRAIAETLLNLFLNILLGKIFGINGIIAATMISLFLCNYLWSVGITFRLYYSFDLRRQYYSYQLKHTIITIIIGIIVYALCQPITYDNNLSTLIFRIPICIIVPNLIYYIFYRKSRIFKEIIDTLRKMR